MENVFRGQPGANLTLEHIERAINLLLHGLGMACELQTTLMAILNLHGKLSVPLTKYVHTYIVYCLPKFLIKLWQQFFKTFLPLRSKRVFFVLSSIDYICRKCSI